MQRAAATTCPGSSQCSPQVVRTCCHTPQHQQTQTSGSAQLPPCGQALANAALRLCDPAATLLSASKHGPQAARTCHASPGPYEVALLQQLGLSRNRGVVAGQSVNDAVLQTDGGSQRQRRGHYAEA